jgi:hypothetical protein
MFRRTLLFSQGAATALYMDQAVQSLAVLCDIDDNMIKEMCRAIRKPGEGAVGYSISELSVASSCSPSGPSTCGAPLARWTTGPRRPGTTPHKYQKLIYKI